MSINELGSFFTSQCFPRALLKLRCPGYLHLYITPSFSMTYFRMVGPHSITKCHLFIILPPPPNLQHNPLGFTISSHFFLMIMECTLSVYYSFLMILWCTRDFFSKLMNGSETWPVYFCHNHRYFCILVIIPTYGIYLYIMKGWK